jgi:hypothetical protein
MRFISAAAIAIALAMLGAGCVDDVDRTVTGDAVPGAETIADAQEGVAPIDACPEVGPADAATAATADAATADAATADAATADAATADAATTDAASTDARDPDEVDASPD